MKKLELSPRKGDQVESIGFYAYDRWTRAELDDFYFKTRKFIEGVWFATMYLKNKRSSKIFWKLGVIVPNSTALLLYVYINRLWLFRRR